MKKKSMSTLASSLAPRRRDNGNNRDRLAEPRGKKSKTRIPVDDFEERSFADIAPEFVSRSVPVENYAFGAPRDTVPGSQAVDRLANDLLESTIFSHPNGLASHPSVLLCGTEPLASVQSTPDLNMSVDVLEPVRVPGPFADDGPAPAPAPVEGAHSASETVQHFQTVGMAPAIPRKSSRRRAKRAKLVNVAAPDVENHAPKRSFPQSKTTMLDVGKKQDVFIPGSTTAPLGALGTRFDDRMPIPNSNVASPTVINDKVAAMLAATEALKPRGSQVSTPVSSKPSRSKAKKVMSKMRQAFEIFQPRPATPESNIRGKISAPVGLTTCELPNPASHYHLEEVEEASPVSSIEIRLNEGLNLNNHKVRSIVGGCIVRKPVHDDGRSLRSGGSRSSEDPFCEPYEIIRTPTPFEHRLKSSLDSTGVPPVPALNHLDLDDDLEGLLPEKPLCASTPRNRYDKKAVPLGSPSHRYAKADDRHLMLASESERVSAGQAKPKLRLNLEAARLFHDNQDPSTKKHPSPSKDDLSDLETNFRAYAIEQIKKAPSEQRDELMNKFSGLIGPHALTPRDKNVPMKTRSAKEDVVDDFSTASERRYTRDASFLPITHSRIPRPVESSTKVRPTTRYGIQRLPSNPDALETDELQ